MDPWRWDPDLILLALRRQGETVGLGGGVAVVLGGILLVVATHPGSWVLHLALAAFFLPSLIQSVARSRQRLWIALRALLLAPLLPAWRLRRLGTARIGLADGRLLPGWDPPPAHLRLDAARALERRPWLLRAAGPGAVLGTDPGWIWIARPRPDGGVEPISLRRRPGRRS